MREESKHELNLERCDFHPWLLEDHPLRSHPTECIPGLGGFLTEKLAFANSKKFLLWLGFLIFICM